MSKRPAEPLQIKFKSYTPQTKELQNFIVEAPKLGPEASNTVEKTALDIRTQIQAEDQSHQDLDLSNLKPKKANWDLKRDLQKKLDQLDVLTNIAMADLIRI
jgi:coiled-coil domain-containing protein 12